MCYPNHDTVLHSPLCDDPDELWGDLLEEIGSPHWLDAWACFAVLRDLTEILFFAATERVLRFRYHGWIYDSNGIRSCECERETGALK